MGRTKKCLSVLVAVALVGAFMCGNGCKKSGEGRAAASDSVDLCVSCGQIKGSDLCCQPDQPKCSECGLVKGSPGCCNIPKDAKTAALCAMCGQIKGSELCCKPNQATCPSCGLVKGSPGCCKIPKT